MSTVVPQARSSEVESQDALSRESWWNLFDELRLSQQKTYDEYGGATEFFRRERNADADQP